MEELLNIGVGYGLFEFVDGDNEVYNDEADNVLYEVDNKLYDSYQNELLFTAIKNKNEMIVNLVVENGCNINAKGRLGKSPLHAAAECGDIKIFEYLLEKGAKIDQKDNYGRIPLHYAVRRGPLEIIRILLNLGSEIDFQDGNGQTPLFMAANNNNNSDILELLLERGAGINIKDGFGLTPLLRAVETGNYKNVQFLLNAGACIDNEPIYHRHSPIDDGFFLFDEFYLIREAYVVYNENDLIMARTVLKMHFIKLLVANISIDASNVTSEFMLDTIDCSSFQKSFVLEVEEMKKKRFCGVSLYDVLIKTVDPTLADNIEMGRFINSDSLKERFPNYADLIKLKFQEAKKRNSLLNFAVLNAEFNLQEIVPIVHLPNEMKRKIFCYLTNEELKILNSVLQGDN